eukprot:5613230-Pyramimonas_sp.AAC.1
MMDHSLLGGAVARALKEQCNNAEDFDELVQSVFHSAFHEVIDIIPPAHSTLRSDSPLHE